MYTSRQTWKFIKSALTVISSIGSANDRGISAGGSSDRKLVREAVCGLAGGITTGLNVSTQHFSRADSASAGPSDNECAEVQTKLKSGIKGIGLIIE
jgi:hypothetical protein